MGVIKIIDTLDIDKGWLQAQNVSTEHGLFIIGIKGAADDNAAISLDNLKYVVLELGIPSGIDQKPITLQMIKLNFDDTTSLDDRDLDSKTAYVKTGPMPSTIYMRPVAYSDGINEVKTGSMPISINILAF